MKDGRLRDMIHFHWYSFSDLDNDQLYDILSLRCSVFIVDQQSHYLDPDGKDRYAIHLLGTEENKLVAYLRVFPPSDIESYIIFGRVLTASSVRTKGYGKKMMEELLKYCQRNYPGIDIKCSAQFYLKNFYESFGFKAYGDVYDDVGIPHIAMKREG